MNTPALLVSISSLAFGSGGTWTLSDYATTAADSASVNRIYGAKTFGNPASTTKLSAGNGAIVFTASLASDSTEGYTANVGLLHPLTPNWAEIDLSAVTAVSFEYKNSSKITEALVVSFGSGTYSEANSKAGMVYQNGLTSAVALGVNTTWKPATLDLLDFNLPLWIENSAGIPTLDAVLKRVKNLQFTPKALYTADGTQGGKACSRCVGPDMSDLTLELRNITLAGVTGPSFPPQPVGGCEAGKPFTLLDDFADGDRANKLGGYWYVFSDSGDVAKSADLTDLSKGSSQAKMVIDAVKGEANLVASLNKTLGSTWHNYAGWAALGTDLGGEGGLAGGDSITGISFRIRNLGIGNAVETINVKAVMSGISDTALHQVVLATSQLVGDTGQVVCIQPTDLKQPFYVAISERVPFDPAKLRKLAWEAKITDGKTTSINAASASFAIGDVKLHGSSSVSVGLGVRKSAETGFAVRVGEGILSLSGFQGVDRFEVVAVDGRKVASFGPSGSVALSLPRGSYLLVGRRAGKALTKSFAVVR